LLFRGKIDFDFAKKQKVMLSPIVERQEGIFPIYPETEGLTSKYLRRILLPLLNITSQINDFLPNTIKESEKLIDLPTAIGEIHFPQNFQNLQKAKERLSFDELFLISLRMLVARRELQKEKAPKILIPEEILQKFVKNLPFKLTNCQKIAAWQILKDMVKPSPMNRLLEGDVGSGKTVVGAMAVLSIFKAGYQSVWMAPTEILATQHFKNISYLLKPFGLKVALFTSATSNKKGTASLLLESDLIIGTHALIQSGVKFRKIGLVIIDEQHRFGVKQRTYLRQLSLSQHKILPHFLSMTATPIPRTLALAVYGDLDISILDEMPAGRQKVITRLVEPQNRQKAYDFIHNQVKSGRQVFVICPLVEEKEEDRINLFEAERKAVTSEYKKLSETVFPDLRVGIVHGRLKSKDKQEAMEQFSQGKIDILVATAVVEVGIDIPNAAVMMIESAERFGLATLHQFRGRVGRGKHQSYCFLFAQTWNDKVQARLKAVCQFDNGFQLAEKDLQLRGPGELTGVKQWGVPDLKMASLSDIIMIKKAREAAENIIVKIENYPELIAKISNFQKERHLE